MDKKEIACVATEMVCELAMGLALATIKCAVVDPYLNKREKLVTDVGMLPIYWMIGRHWGKTWFKFCDNAFNTDLEYIHNNM